LEKTLCFFALSEIVVADLLQNESSMHLRTCWTMMGTKPILMLLLASLVFPLAGCEKKTTRASLGSTLPSITTGSGTDTDTGAFASTNGGTGSVSEDGQEGTTGDFPRTSNGTTTDDAFPRAEVDTSYPVTIPEESAADPAPSGISNILKTALLIGGGALAAGLVLSLVKKAYQKAKVAIQINSLERRFETLNGEYQPSLRDRLHDYLEESKQRREIGSLKELLKEEEAKERRLEKEEKERERARKKDLEHLTDDIDDTNSPFDSLRERLKNLRGRVGQFGRGGDDETNDRTALRRRPAPTIQPTCDTTPGPVVDLDHTLADLGLGDEPDPSDPDLSDLVSRRRGGGGPGPSEATETERDETDQSEDATSTTRTERIVDDGTADSSATTSGPGLASDEEEPESTPTPAKKPGQQSDQPGNAAEETNGGRPEATEAEAGATKTPKPANAQPDASTPTGTKPSSADTAAQQANAAAKTRDDASPFLFEKDKLKHTRYATRAQAFVLRGMLRGSSNGTIRTELDRGMNPAKYAELYDASGRTTPYNWVYSDSTLARTRKALDGIAGQTYSNGSGWATQTIVPAAQNQPLTAVQYLFTDGNVIAQRQVQDLGGTAYQVRYLDTSNEPVGRAFKHEGSIPGLSWTQTSSMPNLVFPTR